MDKRNPKSPFILVDFNFLHTHSLRPKDALPVLYNKLNTKYKKSGYFSGSEDENIWILLFSFSIKINIKW